MHIDDPQAASRQSMMLQELKYFLLGCLDSPGEGLQSFQRFLSVCQIATCQFTDDERMHHNFRFHEFPAEGVSLLAQMLRPDRRVGEDHAVSVTCGGGVEA